MGLGGLRVGRGAGWPTRGVGRKNGALGLVPAAALFQPHDYTENAYRSLVKSVYLYLILVRL